MFLMPNLQKNEKKIFCSFLTGKYTKITNQSAMSNCSFFVAPITCFCFLCIYFFCQLYKLLWQKIMKQNSTNSLFFFFGLLLKMHWNAVHVSNKVWKATQLITSFSKIFSLLCAFLTNVTISKQTQNLLYVIQGKQFVWYWLVIN